VPPIAGSRRWRGRGAVTPRFPVPSLIWYGLEPAAAAARPAGGRRTARRGRRWLKSPDIARVRIPDFSQDKWRLP
jgi:hypothetical protein